MSSSGLGPLSAKLGLSSRDSNNERADRWGRWCSTALCGCDIEEQLVTKIRVIKVPIGGPIFHFAASVLLFGLKLASWGIIGTPDHRAVEVVTECGKCSDRSFLTAELSSEEMGLFSGYYAHECTELDSGNWPKFHCRWKLLDVVKVVDRFVECKQHLKYNIATFNCNDFALGLYYKLLAQWEALYRPSMWPSTIDSSWEIEPDKAVDDVHRGIESPGLFTHRLDTPFTYKAGIVRSHSASFHKPEWELGHCVYTALGR